MQSWLIFQGKKNKTYISLNTSEANLEMLKR